MSDNVTVHRSPRTTGNLAEDIFIGIVTQTDWKNEYEDAEEAALAAVMMANTFKEVLRNG